MNHKLASEQRSQMVHGHNMQNKMSVGFRDKTVKFAWPYACGCDLLRSAALACDATSESSARRPLSHPPGRRTSKRSMVHAHNRTGPSDRERVKE